MKKRIIQTLKFLGFLFLGIVLLWLAFKKTDFERLWLDLKQADYSWIILSLVFGLVAYLSRARRWMILINPLGYRPKFSSVYHSVMTGYLANLALPRIGELTRCMALGRKEKIPVDQLFGTVLIERTIDFFSLLFIMIVVLFTSSDVLVDLMNNSIFIPAREKLLLVFGVSWILWATLLGIIVISLALLVRYRKNLRKIRFFNKTFTIVRGVLNGLKTITSLERKWEFMFHTVLIWINYALMTWVVVFALESTSGITFGQSFFLLVIGGLAMSAPVQSGFGIFHYAVSRAIVTIADVSMEDGLAYALLTHESQLLLAAILGTISFFLIFRGKKEPVEPEVPLLP